MSDRSEPSTRTRFSFALLPGCLAVLLVLLAGQPAWAVLEQRGAPVVQLGRAVSLAASPGEVSAAALNPAAGSWRTRWGYAAAVSRSFELPEFDRFQLAAGGPLFGGNLTCWAGGFGRTLYTERTIGLASAWPLVDELTAGAGVSLTQVALREHGSDHSAALDLGLLFHRPAFAAGLSARNLLASPFDSFSNNRPPRQLSLSGWYAMLPRVRLHGELAHDESGGWTTRLGLETELFTGLSLRSGYDTSAERIHLGIALSWQGWSVHGAADNHPHLGWSQAFGLEFDPSSTPAGP